MMPPGDYLRHPYGFTDPLSCADLRALVIKQEALLVSWLLENGMGTGKGEGRRRQGVFLLGAIFLIGSLTGNKCICLHGCLGGFNLQKGCHFAHVWKIVPVSRGLGRFTFSPK